MEMRDRCRVLRDDATGAAPFLTDICRPHYIQLLVVNDVGKNLHCAWREEIIRVEENEIFSFSCIENVLTRHAWAAVDIAVNCANVQPTHYETICYIKIFIKMSITVDGKTNPKIGYSLIDQTF